MVVDIMYECGDICEHEFDVEVAWNLGLARELYHVQCFVCYCLESNCCYYMTRKKIILCHISRCTDITTGMLTG